MLETGVNIKGGINDYMLATNFIMLYMQFDICSVSI